MGDWLDPRFILYVLYTAAIFWVGNAYGQDKIRLAQKRRMKDIHSRLVWSESDSHWEFVEDEQTNAET